MTHEPGSWTYEQGLRNCLTEQTRKKQHKRDVEARRTPYGEAV